MEEPRKPQSQAISLDNHVDDNLEKFKIDQKFKEFWEIIDDPKYEKSDLRSIEELKAFIQPDNINRQDEFDRTLLHYAVLRKDDRSIIFLLENGAYLFETIVFDKRKPLIDIFSRTPLMDMPKSAYKKYLDNMIKFDATERKLYIDFEKLFEKRERLGPEKRETGYFFPTEWIYRIKKEKHLQELIQHPVIQLLIFFKWMNCQATNAVNMLFNILFFSVYLLFIIFIESRNSLFGSESCGNVTIAKYVLCGLMWSSIAYFAFFDIFKIIQFFTKFKKNMVGNLLLLLRWTAFLLAIAVTVCTDKCTFEFFCNEVEAMRGISVLITTFSLYFAFVQTPRFAFYGKIFLHTFLQVLMFFVVHFILIVGYAMSFFILIYSSNGDLLIPFDARINGSDSDPPKVNITVGEDTEFDNPGLAIFKSFVMFASEFDASSIPFDRNEHHVATRIVFISYIFVVTVVLFNILIGVTFSEVNKVGKNKALYDSLAFIDVIINFEENRYFYKYILYFFFPSFKLKEEKHPESYEVVITENNISRLKFDFGGRVKVFKDTNCENNFWYYVNKLFLQGKIIVPIIKAANEIVAERYKL